MSFYEKYLKYKTKYLELKNSSVRRVTWTHYSQYGSTNLYGKVIGPSSKIIIEVERKVGGSGPEIVELEPSQFQVVDSTKGKRVTWIHSYFSHHGPETERFYGKVIGPSTKIKIEVERKVGDSGPEIVELEKSSFAYVS